MNVPGKVVWKCLEKVVWKWYGKHLYIYEAAESDEDVNTDDDLNN